MTGSLRFLLAVLLGAVPLSARVVTRAISRRVTDDMGAVAGVISSTGTAISRQIQFALQLLF